MVGKQKGGHQEQEPFTILIHRFPAFNLFFCTSLREHYRLLDPHNSPEESVHSYLSREAQKVRALVCVGHTPLKSDVLGLLPSLELVVGSSAGVEHIDLPECRRRGIAVTNAGTAFSEDVADCAIALLIDVLRRVSSGDRYVRSGLWPKCGHIALGSKLGGKRIGIIGLGNIGSEIAKRLLAFGCSIAYNSRKKKVSVPFPFYANVRDLAANSDVLVLCCSLTNETYHIINTDVMKALGKDGVVINVGRGGLVDEKELVRSLVGGEIGGAGLDVFEDEPDVPKELCELDNVVLSPHASVLTPESFEALHDTVLANLNAFFSNKPLVSPFPNE
ncbi:glyoxylate/hydroxypyruvate reductase HPR3-like [Tripterygium wilfordii]|uniref:glyoxylate reductase (NADP(+)) n=1 Tax=Tripterygium wilfordii TaxID=458696 RepID=A0A7J7C836_TRIWF|nr:glyoxylate/hydroxypyruvate reductase HPR3-like [Tripterygium wilfordii]KAF5729926.1 glyoxylate/hydroxypyruvate reductase HPR3-like [Tripterygium wilfordii]